MYKFRNVTAKEDFDKINEWADRKIYPTTHPTENVESWKITDRFGNNYNLVFDGNAIEWSIHNISSAIPLRVDFLLRGRDIEILRAQKGNKHYKSDRFLKQFDQLVLMASCYNIYGCLK